jgi:hypothetical protein
MDREVTLCHCGECRFCRMYARYRARQAPRKIAAAAAAKRRKRKKDNERARAKTTAARKARERVIAQDKRNEQARARRARKLEKLLKAKPSAAEIRMNQPYTTAERRAQGERTSKEISVF